MVFSIGPDHEVLYHMTSRMKVRQHVFGLLAIFILSTLSLIVVWSMAPESHGPKPTRFPQSLEELKVLAEFLKEYRDEHYFYTVLMFSMAYLYKQTFAIPGSFFMTKPLLFLNLLAGALFGKWFGAFIVCPLTALGATLCFILSWTFASPVIERFFLERVRKLRKTVQENSHRLFYFLTCARIFPLTPHWLINISSPFLDIPIQVFSASVLVGSAPYNFLCVRAGGVLADIKKTSDVLDVKTLLELLGCALVMLAIGIMAKKKEVPVDESEGDLIPHRA